MIRRTKAAYLAGKAILLRKSMGMKTKTATLFSLSSKDKYI
jgi:hypothetical protein